MRSSLSAISENNLEEKKGVMVVKIVEKLLVGFQQQPKGSNSFL